MIDHEDIRARLRARFSDLDLSLTGKWLKDHGIGQTTVRNFLDGMSQSLTVETLNKLAGPLKTSERWLLFGNDNALTDDVLRGMAEIAAEEIQAGMRIEEIRNTVASALREQLRLHLTVGVAPGSQVEGTDLDKGALPPAPTNEDGQEGSRTS
ncbi:hypothetical protein WBP07_18095 [Novosphingobium sp. BL-8A]|uniref:hypothetical protein n=1 Tax=Novosphingobium sp. BL-8A TaxID=3127639 RepID=UPI0037565ED3